MTFTYARYDDLSAPQPAELEKAVTQGGLFCRAQFASEVAVFTPRANRHLDWERPLYGRRDEPVEESERLNQNRPHLL